MMNLFELSKDTIAHLPPPTIKSICRSDIKLDLQQGHGDRRVRPCALKRVTLIDFQDTH